MLGRLASREKFLWTGDWIEGEQAQEQGTRGLALAVAQDREMCLEPG